MSDPADNSRVATFGDINVDVILEVDDLPQRGGEVFSTRRLEVLGGSAANTAAMLVRLGLQASVMGAVGDDDAGRLALHRLGLIGVDTDLTWVSEVHPTAMNTILVTPDRERTMVGARGANVHYETPRGWDDAVRWLHLSGYALMAGPQRTSALQVIDEASTAGIPCSLDVPVGVGARIRDVVTARLDRLRVLTGSRRALEELTGDDDPITELAGEERRVAVTAGPAQFVVGEAGERVAITPPVVEAVDVTGAGDSFAAGMIAGDLFGLGIGPTAVMAAAAGAATTQVRGASGGLGDMAGLADVLQGDRWSDVPEEWLGVVRSKLSVG